MKQQPKREAPPRGLLDAWLKSALAVAGSEPIYLRGSLMIDALIPNYRAPMDIDYLVDRAFDAEWTAQLSRAIAAGAAGAGSADLFDVEAMSGELIFAETAFPGVRVRVPAAHPGEGPAELVVDFGFGDPLSTPPKPLPIPGVGAPLAIAPETLFAFKLHGLAEYGRGKWRAKDLADLYMMWTRLTLDRAVLREAIELAFSSRGMALGALDDFRDREAWGQSSGGQKKWRQFNQRMVEMPDFEHVRSVVRRAVTELLAG